jgi:hypothetical protein
MYACMLGTHDHTLCYVYFDFNSGRTDNLETYIVHFMVN